MLPKNYLKLPRSNIWLGTGEKEEISVKRLQHYLRGCRSIRHLTDGQESEPLKVPEATEQKSVTSSTLRVNVGLAAHRNAPLEYKSDVTKQNRSAKGNENIGTMNLIG